MKHFNKLTAAQDERLAILSEECAEVIQIINKIQRHGYNSYHPRDPHTTNRQLLEKEIGHVRHAVELMINIDICNDFIEVNKVKKGENIGQYLHHQS